MRLAGMGIGLVVILLAAPRGVSGGEPYVAPHDGRLPASRPYDGLQAGAEAAARHEARRLAEIRHQLDTIELMKWYSGLPPGDAGAFYSYGRAPRRGVDPRAGWWGPWMPYLVGGVPYAAIAPQPIGQRHVQTGPNRWESHPVYAPPGGIWIERPAAGAKPDREPEPEVPSGPREF